MAVLFRLRQTLTESLELIRSEYLEGQIYLYISVCLNPRDNFIVQIRLSPGLGVYQVK